MPPAHPGPSIRLRQVTWREAWRVIGSRFPPINLFERLSSNPAVWEALIALEQVTNPRIRDEVGNISLVPPDRRVSGHNASWVMAPFTHINSKGSRFSSGAYGIYYAAAALITAIRETAYHFGRFAADSHDPALRREDFRVLLGSVERTFEDIASVEPSVRVAVLNPNSYAASQTFAAARRESDSEGFVYPSVRHVGGECIAAFWPNTVGIPIQERHLKYEWNGHTVSRYFDYREDEWFGL
jgi:RES domain